jgi:hypothetical protein
MKSTLGGGGDKDEGVMTEDDAFEKALGKLVSNRNHFTGSAEYAESLLEIFRLMQSRPDASDEMILLTLQQAVNIIVDGTLWAFKTASANGMEQAARLIADPKFNTILAERQKRWMESARLLQEQQNQERIANKNGMILARMKDGKVQ